MRGSDERKLEKKEENILSTENVLYSDRSIDWNCRKGERKLCQGERLRLCYHLYRSSASMHTAKAPESS